MLSSLPRNNTESTSSRGKEDMTLSSIPGAKEKEVFQTALAKRAMHNGFILNRYSLRQERPSLRWV